VIASSQRLGKLTSLVLTHNRITDAVVDDWMFSPVLAAS